jgi:hypothetical protein
MSAIHLNGTDLLSMVEKTKPEYRRQEAGGSGDTANSFAE